MAILPNLAQEAAETIARMQAEIDALKAKQTHRALSMKVTAKRKDEKTGEMVGTDGAISVYGLGRFPVTLYAASWERLLDEADTIRAFISANAATISRK
jgi:hypothetical protein